MVISSNLLFDTKLPLLVRLAAQGATLSFSCWVFSVCWFVHLLLCLFLLAVIQSQTYNVLCPLAQNEYENVKSNTNVQCVDLPNLFLQHIIRTSEFHSCFYIISFLKVNVERCTTPTSSMFETRHGYKKYGAYFNQLPSSAPA